MNFGYDPNAPPEMPMPMPMPMPGGGGMPPPQGMPGDMQGVGIYPQLGMPGDVPGGMQGYPQQPQGMPQPDPYDQNTYIQNPNPNPNPNPNIEKSTVLAMDGMGGMASIAGKMEGVNGMYDNFNMYEFLPIGRDDSDLNGPVPKPRGKFKCRDVPFLILFIIFWVGLIVISFNAFVASPYDTLLYGRNSAGELCGSGNFTDYKYVAYFFSTEQMLNAENPIKYKVCTNFCPSNYLLYEDDLFVNDPTTNETISYVPYLDINNSTYEENHLIDVEDKFKNKDLYEIYELTSKMSQYDNYLIPSYNIFNRCIPDLDIFGVKINETSWSDMLQGGINFSSRVFQSVVNSIDIILMEAGIALGLTFVWLIFIYLFTGVFVWITVILSILALGGATLFSWYIYKQSRVKEIRSTILDTNNPYVNKYLYNEKFFLGVSILLSIIFVFTFIFFLFAKKRINLGIKVIEESGKAVMKYPMLTIIPLIQFIFIIGITLFFALIFIPVTITSNEDISVSTRHVISKYTPLQEDDISVKSYGLIIELYVVLGFYWTYYFIKAVGKTTICGVIATWYWAPTNGYNEKLYQHNAIIKTFCRVCWYNLGSLAFGSLILGIISLIKYILAKAQKIAKKNGDNEFVKCMIRCLRCCVECIDKIVKFITKNAYVEIAIYGYSFCKATFKATKIISRNLFRVIVIDRISAIIFVLGKALVTGITVFLTYYILKNRNINDTYMLTVPLIISFVLSLTIISVFMSVLSSTIDTIFISVLEDLERNNGTKEKPYYMSKKIRKLVVKDSDNLEQEKIIENMY